MKSRILRINSVIFLGLFLSTALGTHAQTTEQNLRKHVFYMAADSLNGRKAGSMDANKVAHYIAREYEKAGLKPFFDNWFYDFHLGYDTATTYRDVVGWIEGTDPELKNQYILVGAHYDHLGVKNNEIYNGADDNASGSATVIEMARMLAQKPLKYSVIFCAFDAEEIGLHGSTALSRKLNKMNLIPNIRLMMSIDMVGWYSQSGFLRLAGVGTLEKGRKMMHDLARMEDATIHIKTVGFEGSPVTATDTEPFARLQVPTLAVTTGLKSPYHKPQDDADLIDYEGMELVTRYLTNLVENLADGEHSVEASGHVAYKHRNEFPALQPELLIGRSNCHLSYPDAKLYSRQRGGFIGGLNLKWNFSRNWALVTGARYHFDRLYLADEANPFASFKEGKEQCLSVPFMAEWHAGTPTTGLWLRLGGCYSRLISASCEGNDRMSGLNENQVGLAWELGFNVSRVTFSVGGIAPFRSYPLPTSALPQKKVTTEITLGFTF